MNQNLQNKSKISSTRRGIDTIITYQVADYKNVAIWLIDHFGLPGERYTFHFMDIGVCVTVYDEKDYVWFRLHW